MNSTDRKEIRRAAKGASRAGEPMTDDELRRFQQDPLSHVIGSPGYWAGRLLATVAAWRARAGVLPLAPIADPPDMPEGGWTKWGDGEVGL